MGESWPRVARMDQSMSGKHAPDGDWIYSGDTNPRSGQWLLARTVGAWQRGDRMAQSRSGTPTQANLWWRYSIRPPARSARIRVGLRQGRGARTTNSWRADITTGP